MLGPGSPPPAQQLPPRTHSCHPPRTVKTFPVLLMNTSRVTGGEGPADSGSTPAAGPGQACPSQAQEEMRLAANCYPPSQALLPAAQFPPCLYCLLEPSFPSPSSARLTAPQLTSPLGIHGIDRAPTKHGAWLLVGMATTYPALPHPSCVISGKCPALSETVSSSVTWRELGEVLCVKQLEPCPAQDTWS